MKHSLIQLDSFINATRPLGLLGVKINIGKTLVGEWYLEEEHRRNVYSAAKSFTVCAVGFALQENLLSLDEKLTDAFAEDLPSTISENLSCATVKDLLTMHLGQERSYLRDAERPLLESDNWVRLSLRFPFLYSPGSKFVYNNVGPYLAGVLVQRRAKCNLVEYLTPRLFTYLGIKNPTWETDPLGNTFGSAGLMLTLSELHRFGLFCLQQGKWNGNQLLDSDWINECSRQHYDAPYGYCFWCGKHHSFRADGKYSQLSIIFPDEQAVVTTFAECRDGDRFLNVVYELLYPQISR